MARCISQMDLLLTKYMRANIDYEGLTRTETYDYPEEALREALLNTLIHKDYSSANPIQISVYKDWLMIYNNGELPKNWTVETLKQKHTSEPANPDIANAFFRAGYIEIWGRGTINIVNDCKDAGLPEPKFTDEWGGLAIIFYAGKGSGKNDSQKTVEKTVEKIFSIIKDNPQITQKQLASITGLSRRGVEWNLKKLKEKGLIRRVGPDKGGYWEIPGNK